MGDAAAGAASCAAEKHRSETSMWNLIQSMQGNISCNIITAVESREVGDVIEILNAWETFHHGLCIMTPKQFTKRIEYQLK
jgi:hypothetical protein